MEQKKSVKGLIVLVIILIVLILGLGGYIVYDKILNNKININDIKENKIIGNILPSNINDYNAIYWDYQKIYDYYFTMEDKENLTCRDNPEECNLYSKYSNKNYNIGSSYSFVKIENNKLYWNFDNNWIQDENIKEDITYFFIEFMEGDIAYFTIGTNNKLYVIKPKENIYMNTDNNDAKFIVTKNIYDSFKYNIVNIEGNISNIVAKSYPEDCEGYTVLYIEIDDKIFVLDHDNELLELNYFINKYKSISRLDNTCSPQYGNIIDINFDGSLNNVYDNNGKTIIVKYYIQTYMSDQDNKNNIGLYDLIIDNDNNLYIINRNKEDITKINKLSSKTKINKIDAKEIEGYAEIKIELIDRTIIEFK